MIFPLLLFSFIFLVNGHFECGHGLKQNHIPEQDIRISRFESRIRQSARVFDSPIRIHIDTSNINGTERERALITRVMSKLPYDD